MSPVRTTVFIQMIALVAITSVMFFAAPQTSHGAFSDCVAGIGGSRLVNSARAITGQTVPTAPTDATANDGAFFKECFLDGTANLLKETLIRRVTSATVTWINSGFEGSPAFVTDLDQFLRDTADETFGEYIARDANFSHLCQPWQFDIRFSLALNYSTVRRPTCRLSDVADNIDTAIDDLSVDFDWNVFETVTTNSGGNPIFAYIQASEDFGNLLDAVVTSEEDDVNRGGGFRSYKVCTDGSETNTYELTEDTGDQRCEVKTPGSTIRDGLSANLSQDLNRLGIADEFDEIVGALMGQLFQQAFGQDGVAGLSQRSSASESFVSQYGSDLDGDAAQSASETTALIAGQLSGITEYISTQTDQLQDLLEAKIAITEVYNCYDSKYNTWIDVDGNVIDPDVVDSIPESDRVRASFINDRFNDDLTPEILTPLVSAQRSLEYQSVLDRIDQDLVDTQQSIEQAQAVSAQSETYRLRLAATTNPIEVQAIFDDYSRTSGGTNFDVNEAQAGLDTVRTYIDQAVNGTLTFIGGEQTQVGGSVNDLALCRSFNQAYSGSRPSGATDSDDS